MQYGWWVGYPLRVGTSEMLSTLFGTNHPQPWQTLESLLDSVLKLRFLPPLPAVLSIDHSELQGRRRLRTRDMVRVLICIESLCHHHT